MEIVKEIGLPAVLEQLAEECAELSQVALKKARILRNENPTNARLSAVDLNLIEESGDVINCLEVLTYINNPLVDEMRTKKLTRWVNRIIGKMQDEN